MTARARALVAVLLAASAARAAGQDATLRPRREAGRGTAVGIEYVLLTPRERIAVEAQAFAGTGLTAAKHYAEHVEWGEMQAGPRARIDFSRLDAYVVEFQRAGFGDLVLCLKSRCRWAAREAGLLQFPNPTPKPEFMDAYAAWIEAVVERYDGDGRDDVPGLRWPVRHLEVGSEFSSYEPEPVADYLAILERAYRAAHRASGDVRVAHAAFLTIGAFDGRPEPGEAAYREAWGRMPSRIAAQHDYADVRAILDRPDLFDVANLHSLCDPYDLEDAVRWLRWEMAARNYDKPIVVSDTIPTSWIALGPATTCEGRTDRLGLLLRPAKESDRCRLAEYFTRLVKKDAETLRWTRGFVAADTVQRVVIACSLDVELIDVAFNMDLPFLTEPPLSAGAGVSAWAGALEWRWNRIVDRRPLYHALRQMMGHLAGHEAVRRVDVGDPRARVYRIEKPGLETWVAWLEVDRPVLPGDVEPTLGIALPAGHEVVSVEPVITRGGQERPDVREVRTEGGRLSITLDRVPVYLVGH